MSFLPGLSYWERESFFKGIDFCVLGSGIVGISAAIRLRELHPNAKIIILERGMLPSGASTRNAGFACFGSISELLDDLENSTEDEMLALVEKRWQGLQRLMALTGDRLRYNECGGFEIFLEKDKELYHTCMEKMPYFNEKLQGIIGRKPYSDTSNMISAFGISGAEKMILNNAEGHIDTGSMMAALIYKAKDINISIFNGAHIIGIENSSNGLSLECSDGRQIRTAKLLIATNGFASTFTGEASLQPARNQVLITKPIPGLKVKGTFHYDQGYYYFRDAGDNRILFGGGRNLSPKAETTENFGTTDIIKERLLKMMRELILPDTPFEVDMWWSGILGVGPVKQPIIKKLDEHTAIAVRMGGMGVAIGSLVGTEGAELLA